MSAQGVRAGKAYVELGVHDKLAAGLKRAQARLKAFGAGLRNIGAGMAGMGAGIVAPLLAAGKVFSDVGDAIDKASARTGLSAEALSELGFAAEQSGADLETLEKGVQKMQRSIVDAADGTQTAVDAFARLGLTAQELAGLGPEEQFKLIADQISRIEDPTLRAATAMEILGKSGTKLLPLFADGAAGIEALQQQARDLGLTITTDAAGKAALLTDTLNIMRRTLHAVALAIGEAVAPAMIAVAEHVARVAVAVGRFVRENQALIAGVLKVGAVLVGIGGTLVGAGLAVSLLGTALGGLATAVTAAGAVLGALLSPIALVGAAVAAAGTAIVLYTSAGGDALAWLGGRFSELWNGVRGVVSGIADAIAAGDLALAARVGLAALNVAFETGLQPIRALWSEFRFALESTGVAAFYGLKKGWVEFSTWMWSHVPNLTKFVLETFVNVVADIRDAWARLMQWLADVWHSFFGLLDSDYDVAAAKAVGAEQLAERRAGIEGDRKAGLAEAERKGSMTPEEHAAERAKRLAEIAREESDALKSLEKSHGDRVAAAEAAQAAAEAELAAARAAAAEARAAGAGLPAGAKRPALPDIDAAVAAASQRINVVGTFNPAAISGLGSGSVTERIARAGEATARNTDRIERKIERQRFAE